MARMFSRNTSVGVCPPLSVFLCPIVGAGVQYCPATNSHADEREAHETEMQHLRTRAMTNAEQFAAALLAKEKDLERQEAEVYSAGCLHLAVG
jgi:hypothetical protein